MNARSLSRSRNFPLDITFLFGSADNSSRTQHSLESFKLACRHIHRWRTTHLCFNALVDDQILELLARPAPLLEKVDIETYSWPMSSKYLPNLFGGEAHRMRSVRLAAVSVPWSAGMLSGLEVLELAGIRPGPPIAEAVLATLLSSPRLVVLKLKAIVFDHASLDSSEYPIIHLSHLRNLNLSGLHHHTVSLLLRQIQAPSCQCLTLSSVLDDLLDVPSFMLLVQPFIPRIVAAACPPRLDVGFDYLDYSVDFPPDSPYHLNMSFDGIAPAPFIRAFLSILPPEFLQLDTKMSLNDDHLPEEIEGILPTADKARITQLSLDLVSPQANASVLGHLTKRPWLFPALDVLVIDIGHTTAGALLSMVRSRYGILSQAEDTAALPNRFTKLGVFGSKSNHDSDREELEALVGKEVLSWSRNCVPED